MSTTGQIFKYFNLDLTLLNLDGFIHLCLHTYIGIVFQLFYLNNKFV